MVISVPGLASQRKLLQMPFFSGSSAFFSGSQYVARRTHSVVVLPSYLSPYLRGHPRRLSQTARLRLSPFAPLEPQTPAETQSVARAPHARFRAELQ